MYGFVAQTCRFSKAKPLGELHEGEVHKVIEAIKLRISQEKAKLAKTVPF
jgi:hypothetical protein